VLNLLNFKFQILVLAGSVDERADRSVSRLVGRGPGRERSSGGHTGWGHLLVGDILELLIFNLKEKIVS
jgi:hypothetical protein